MFGCVGAKDHSVANAGAAPYNLEPLGNEHAARWNELIRRYDTREIFHCSQWLDYLRATRGLDIRFWRILNGDNTAGYFCGGLFRKGPYRILGSPLRSWGTNYMGPVANRDLDQAAFLLALDRLARSERLDMIELENPLLEAENMTAMGYVAVPQLTFIVPLSADPREMWSRMAQRSQVRKAQRAGLTVEDAGDIAVADEFYEQCAGVLRRKGVAMPFSPGVPRHLFRCLKPHDMLFSLRVRDAAGATVATGLFPHDDRSVVYWFGACTADGYRLAANDLMHWTVMEWAALRGLTRYDLSGNGFFKSKFGGTLHTLNRWYKCFSPTARYARRAYELYYRRSRQWRKRWRPWWKSTAEQPE